MHRIFGPPQAGSSVSPDHEFTTVHGVRTALQSRRAAGKAKRAAKSSPEGSAAPQGDANVPSQQTDKTPALPREQTREFDIDPFRGLVCLSLVALHFYRNGPLGPELDRLLGQAGTFAIVHVRLGVESFFVLAGFMMAHMLRPVAGENVSIGAYLKRRFYRLIVPFWVAVVLAGLDRWLLSLVVDTQRGGPGLSELLAQLTLSREFFGFEDAAPGYWSMVSLEQFYLLFLGSAWCCYQVWGRSGGRYGAAERALAWLTCASCVGSAALLIAQVPSTVELPQWGIYLGLGLMLYWSMRQRFARTEFAIGLAALTAVAVYTRESRSLAALVGIACLMYLGRGARLPNWRPIRWLAFCGQRSYSIYLVHAIVGIRVLTFVRFLDRSAPWAAPVLCLAAFAASLFAAELFFRFVERPWQARARRVDYRGRADAVSWPAPVISPLAVVETAPVA